MGSRSAKSHLKPKQAEASLLQGQKNGQQIDKKLHPAQTGLWWRNKTRMFGHIEMFEKILPTFFARKEAQINRFGHIEGSVIFLPILLAQNDGHFFSKSSICPNGQFKGLFSHEIMGKKTTKAAIYPNGLWGRKGRIIGSIENHLFFYRLLVIWCIFLDNSGEG